MSAPPDASELLPHRPPALLITTIERWDASGIVCSGRIPAHHPAVLDGAVPAVLGLEMGAQAGAVWGQLQQVAAGVVPAPLGYLVGLREARFPRPLLPVDCRLYAHVEPAGSAGPLAVFSIQIRLPDGSLAVAGKVSAHAGLR